MNSDVAQTPPQPIKRVGIVGAGIAGLSLAHALENLCQSDNDDDDAKSMQGMEISVFDSRPSLNFKDGAGVQVNGGMSVLHKINPDLFASVASAALPLKSIRSRTKPWFPLSLFSGSKEDSPFATLLEFDIEDIIRKTGGETEKELIVDGTTMSYSIMRGALQQVLLDELSSDTSERVKFGRRLIDIESDKNGKDGIMCIFDDGSTDGPFDLVVGCDGIQSNVKQFVDKGKIESSTSKKTNASSIYSGIRIIFAVEDGDPSLPKEDFAKSTELRQYFGNGGYGLTGTYGAGVGQSPSRSAFYIYRDPDYIGPFPKKKESEEVSTSNIVDNDKNESPPENADWSQNVQSSEKDPQADFLSKMKQSSMPSFELIPIVENADRFFELGVYFHNPFSFSGWKREVKGSSGAFCVLAGDSAHAMPPFLGQGANQAIQDAYCLASKISEYNSNLSSYSLVSTTGGNEDGVKSLKELLNEYESQRWRTTTLITLKAAFLGYLEAGQEGFLSTFRDAFFFFAGKVGLARKIYLDGATPKV